MTNEHEAANVRAELARLLPDAADKDLAAFVRHHWPTIDVALYFATRAAPAFLDSLAAIRSELRDALSEPRPDAGDGTGGAA